MTLFRGGKPTAFPLGQGTGHTPSIAHTLPVRRLPERRLPPGKLPPGNVTNLTLATGRLLAGNRVDLDHDQPGENAKASVAMGHVSRLLSRAALLREWDYEEP
jgi:hypothetical protein